MIFLFLFCPWRQLQAQSLLSKETFTSKKSYWGENAKMPSRVFQEARKLQSQSFRLTW